MDKSSPAGRRIKSPDGDHDRQIPPDFRIEYKEKSAVPKRLDGKVAIISGAASGIGERIARQYAVNGGATMIGYDRADYTYA